MLIGVAVTNRLKDKLLNHKDRRFRKIGAVLFSAKNEKIDIESLREEYKEKFGKKPHWSWDSQKLNDKLNETI